MHSWLCCCHSLLIIVTGIECPDLSDPANGAVTVNGQSVGDTADYSCNDGFELVGAMTVTCESDGEWSDDPSVCRRKQTYRCFFTHDLSLTLQHCVLI